MSYAYSLIHQGTVKELLLIDIDKERAEGEAMDLNHGLSYAPGKMKIYAGEYSDCKDAEGVNHVVRLKLNNTEQEQLNHSASMLKSIIDQMDS